MPFGVMFHHFHSRKIKKFGQGSIDKNQFENIIKFLKKNFTILTPEEWILKVEKKKLKKKDICLTFDDALLSQYDVALKILNKYNLKAFWFIYSSVFNGEIDNFEIHRKFRSIYYKNFDEFFFNFSNHTDKNFILKKIKKYKIFFKFMKKFYPIYSDKDIEFRFLRDHVLTQIQYNNILNKMMTEKKTNKKKLSKNLWLKNSHLKKLSNAGHMIGMHAYNHPYKLSELNYVKQLDELKKNFIHLKKVLNKEPISISYPNGSFNKDTLKIINKLKIKCGFLSNMKSYKKLYPKEYVLRRLDHSIVMKEFIK